ncbi:amphi-Trp domain-containing protein [Halomontanus rarus]|uniref:amphi-Trp domain-containing protein n=1 Tax=Halomontanus rarus TaxID=3034020 RepID=UPI0023E814CA|nr:amphi-Trp domain-containing protein [Halovivax sp. TS33]
MPEEVLFKFERSMDRSEIASYLRTVADRLESDEDLVLEAADQNVTLSPPGRPTFEIKAERETSSSSSDGPGELSIEFELEWTEGAGEDGTSADGSLTIE